jgi:hypothetical protein
MGNRNLFSAVYGAMKSLLREQERNDLKIVLQNTLGPLYPPLPGTKLLPGRKSYHSMPERRGCFGKIRDKRLWGRGTSLEERKAMRRGGDSNPWFDAKW